MKKKLALALCAAGIMALLHPAAAVAANDKGNNGNGKGNGGASSSSNPRSNSSSNESASSNSSNSNAGGQGGLIVLDAPCVLSVGGSCYFEGNINLNNKLAEIESAYNDQETAPPEDLVLQGLQAGEQGGGFTNDHFGTITSPFLVRYYAVKGGSGFRLYEIDPSNVVNWSTAGLLNGGGNEPGVSHVAWFEAVGVSPTGGTGGLNLTTPVPEPASWALMILGVGVVGGALRSRRAKVAAAA